MSGDPVLSCKPATSCGLGFDSQKAGVTKVVCGCGVDGLRLTDVPDQVGLWPRGPVALQGVTAAGLLTKLCAAQVMLTELCVAQVLPREVSVSKVAARWQSTC
jgi:hypothetical protein